ncbi:B12 binding protein [Anseongella ginsenosidimutans]|uniref:B12 binding protein n=1 Tax=Anseongella ginsenosidimutans TaxID=496056 RepID=A0A4R3KPY8_9SPHI|nr:MerR family transcriptional regulator [Anseongella ginsenosidimutans]QEC52269.1 MerR family transcriptional regulator [Anseongella ginsenosidimutans]TCS86824.1 B12 binding protein [Anseongella ginsenosidimutans]
MKKFSIRDIECLTGIKAHTIRIWEQRYNLVPPKRTETNIRYYDNSDLKKFLNISTLLENGFRISKVAEMTEGEMCDLIAELVENNHVCDKANALCTATLKLDEQQFNRTISSCVAVMGIEHTFTDVIFPFMRKIGLMWQVGTINPAHEHFITHLIRQKLHAAIDELPTVNSELARKYLLFLPEGETHEVGLLFANYLLKARGQHVLYLGQNLPLSDLEQIVNYYHPNYVLTTLTSDTVFGDMNCLVKKIQEVIPGIPVLLTGPLVKCNQVRENEFLHTLRDIRDLPEFIRAHSHQGNVFFTC